MTPVAVYKYFDDLGRLVAEKLRYEVNGSKSFGWRRPSSNGSGWIDDVEDIALPLYNLPQVVKADVVLIAEGEKDANTLAEIVWEIYTGLGAVVATTTAPSGAKTWKSTYGPYLTGKRAVIFPDRDRAGEQYLEDVIRSIAPYAASVKLVRIPDGKDVTEYRKRHSDDELIRLMREAREVERTSEEWPEPEDLGAELPPVPKFDPLWLPRSLRVMCVDVADRMQVPMDFVAAVVIVTLAGVCGRRAMIQPKAQDFSWEVIPNLWGGIVARPGLLKSPTSSSVTRPLHTIEAEWRKKNEADKEKHALDRERYELELEVWKKKFKEAKAKGETLPDRPEKPDSGPPQERRLMTTDATPEKLHDLMSQNPAGIFVLRDELTGWLAGLERAGRESERQFFLESWAGDQPYTMDRVVRGSVHVPHCCLSLFGSLQPSPLRQYLTGSAGERADDDGLLQRFQILVWPDPPADWQYIDRPPNGNAIKQAAEVFRRIAEMDVKTPRVFHFSPEAQKNFQIWLEKLEDKLRHDDLSSALQSHLAKFRSLNPSLALLFCLADGVLKGAGFLENVGDEYEQSAANVCAFLESHAIRVYSARIAPEIAQAVTLAKKLETGWRRDEGSFTARDIYRHHWSGLSTPEEVAGALKVLEEAGWIRSSEIKTGGRPSEVYAINPKLKKPEISETRYG